MNINVKIKLKTEDKPQNLHMIRRQLKYPS